MSSPSCLENSGSTPADPLPLRPPFSSIPGPSARHVRLLNGCDRGLYLFKPRVPGKKRSSGLFSFLLRKRNPRHTPSPSLLRDPNGSRTPRFLDRPVQIWNCWRVPSLPLLFPSKRIKCKRPYRDKAGRRILFPPQTIERGQQWVTCTGWSLSWSAPSFWPLSSPGTRSRSTRFRFRPASAASFVRESILLVSGLPSPYMP